MPRSTAFLLLALAACSTRSGGTGRDAAVSDLGATDAPATHDASVDAPATDAPATDAPPGDMTPTDAGFDPHVSHPPAGYTLCGHGTFTSAQAAMGCMTPSLALDDMPLPDGGFGSTPRDCSALTTSGGAWEAWCMGPNVYLWARFDDVSASASPPGCLGGILYVDEGVWDSGSGGGNGAHVSTYLPDGTEIAGAAPGMPETAVYELMIDGTPGAMNSANLFLLGSRDCAPMGFMPPEVLAGITVTWTAP